jgi:hypothetical protein
MMNQRYDMGRKAFPAALVDKSWLSGRFSCASGTDVPKGEGVGKGVEAAPDCCSQTRRTGGSTGRSTVVTCIS